MILDSDYLGFKLKSPVIVASSGLTDNIENLLLIDELGAGAIVLKSLFEEQIISNIHNKHYHENANFHKSLEFSENLNSDKVLDNYINLISQAKKQTKIPIIASINCVSSEIWYYFASKLEDAGSDALELNINIPLISENSIDALLNDYFHIIENVVNNVGIPVSIKLQPYFPNYKLLINTFQDIGVKGIVLFNRTFSPDIDLNNLKIFPNTKFSSSSDLYYSLRWIALLAGKSKIDISASTGYHNFEDILKAILFGASSTQLCSTLYINGLEYIKSINTDLINWISSHNYNNIREIRGLLIKEHNYSEDYERIQYMVRDNYK